MLPSRSRVRRRDEFTAATRRGRRAAAGPVVVHLLQQRESVELGPRAGFVVGRQIGSAVTRNRVRRRLQHLMAARLPRLANGAVVVVRARPGAEGASSAELGLALDRALDQALDRVSSSRAPDRPWTVGATADAGSRQG